MGVKCFIVQAPGALACHPTKKIKQSWRANLSIYKHCLWVNFVVQLLPSSLLSCRNCSVWFYKGFTIVIYDYYGNGLHYKTTVLATLALATSINNNYKVCCKLRHTLQTYLTVINYICKTIILQITRNCNVFWLIPLCLKSVNEVEWVSLHDCNFVPLLLNFEFVMPIEVLLKLFSWPGLPVRGISMRMLHWLDGTRTPAKYLIICVRGTLNSTVCVLAE